LRELEKFLPISITVSLSSFALLTSLNSREGLTRSSHSFLVYGDSPQSGLLRVVRNRDGELLEVGDDLIRRTDRRELNRVF